MQVLVGSPFYVIFNCSSFTVIFKWERIREWLQKAKTWPVANSSQVTTQEHKKLQGVKEQRSCPALTTDYINKTATWETAKKKEILKIAKGVIATDLQTRGNSRLKGSLGPHWIMVEEQYEKLGVHLGRKNDVDGKELGKRKRKHEFKGLQIMWFRLFRGCQAAWFLIRRVE